ncbi:hypothetical protein [Cryptosporangium aurantiacum]|uniref:Uncharacterized protein n=1 Tax=Cryptosporangium aurantiacum TaxID=134849 RepID=A0A1M7RPC0_9ACTN|nr:hypothetical protein [Cryptosporangium aurantiacum]SHN48207.1 hypothetical protein SAMN05443668_13625 [Cryptosporangium aurantiacum]
MAPTITVKDNGYGAHRITLDTWSFSVDTETGRLFRVASGPGVGPHGDADPPFELTTALGALEAGRWLSHPHYFFRVDLVRLGELAAAQVAEAAAVEAAKPAPWLTPMKASTRGTITTADIAGLWNAIGAARKSRGDLEGAYAAARAAYGVRLADAVRWRERDTTEAFHRRILAVKEPTRPRVRRARKAG